MRDPFVFDPRSECCKKPYGAVPCGTAVSYTVRPLCAEGWSRCVLVARREFSNLETETELPCTGIDGNRNRFSGTFPAPAEPELVWYWFRLSRPDGCTILFDKSGWHTDGSVQSWQLTVYEETPTPAWFGRGVTYQIFPDRFCRLSVPDPAGMIGDRWVHENWSDIPEWRPDSQGEVRNRDFFGGSLQGIISKLDDLAAFGVTTLYLNPIFESASNHRYNTADYLAIDPMLGTEADFRQLCREAKSRGIRVILDGVFNHTGSQSRYFNADGFYPAPGAAQSQDSPYFSWFSFHPWPTDYDAWWGIKTLPAVQENDSGYRDFIIRDRDSVVRHWLRAGASGWRLDVADELPDDFIADIRTAMDETAPGSLLLGEVWEDATTKVAYSQRRRYLLGHELHGVMNYPFRNAIIAYLLGGDADEFRETLEVIRENYPPDFNRIGCQPCAGQQGGTGILPSLPRGAADGAGAAPAGGPGAVHLPRFSHRLLRRRSRYGGLGGPLQPGGLPLGPGGHGTESLVCPVGPPSTGLPRFAVRAASLVLDRWPYSGLCPGTERPAADYRDKRR